MFKKLFNTGINASGNIINFTANLKREVKLWKLVTLFVLILMLILFVSKQNDEPITTKQIASLKKDVIAEVLIEGPIMQNFAQEKLLDEIYKSEKIKGLLVTIDSPGGDATQSEIIYLKLKKIRSKIPVIVSIRGLGASGGYMIALGGEKIIAMKSSLVGSIGVISSPFFDISEVLKKHNISADVYRTTEYKSHTMYQKTTLKQKEYMQDLINQIGNMFYEIVKEERKLSGNNLENVINAKVFGGQKALELNLIDAIGTKEYALEILKESIKNKGYKKNLEVQEIKEEAKQKNNLAEYISLTVNFFEKFLMHSKKPVLASM